MNDESTMIWFNQVLLKSKADVGENYFHTVGKFYYMSNFIIKFAILFAIGMSDISIMVIFVKYL